MKPYTLTVALHVIVAVLGAGQVGAIPLGVLAARRAGHSLAQIHAWLDPLLRVSRASLGLLILTGVGLDALTSGAYRHEGWTRLSMLLAVALIALHGWARSALSRGLRGEISEVTTLQRVEWTGWGMSALVAVVAALMEAKPF